MKLSSNSFSDGDPIPTKYAFGKMSPDSHVALSDNISPHLAWQGAPADTKSFVLICHDPDVPSSGEDVNQEGRHVPETLPRVDFFHWLLLDIPAGTSEVTEGSHAQGITPKGKPGPERSDGMRQGINDYTGWFAGDPDMGGEYYGYDGPCPPWNDARLHHYIFTVYALDVEKLPVHGEITGKQVLEAMQGHILDQASIMGVYTLNPELSL